MTPVIAKPRKTFWRTLEHLRPMETAAARFAPTKRALILHDSLAFVTLLSVSIALFIVTLFLFRSFGSHRADLATRWAERGRLALQQSRPEQAVAALRTALSYAPDDYANQLLLAQALAGAGHTEEAVNYFLNLWEARPGDGLINLQLARLARKRGESKDAVDYYHASVFGSWEGDGVVRRREVRLELVDYLLQRHDLSQARDELFIIAGNAPNDPELNLLLARKFVAAGDLPTALSFDEKALAIAPRDPAALEYGGRLAYNLGDFLKAEKLLDRSLREAPVQDNSVQLSNMLKSARKIQQLTLTRDQPAAERADHILFASSVAQDRLKSCSAQTPPSPVAAAQIKALSTAWTAATASRAPRHTLLQNAGTQDAWTQLIFQTEQQTATFCSNPTPNDLLILRLANSAPAVSGIGKEY